MKCWNTKKCSMKEESMPMAVNADRPLEAFSLGLLGRI